MNIVNGTFAATGQSDVVNGDGCDVTLSKGGGTMTIKLEVGDSSGAWHVADDDVAEGLVSKLAATNRPWRLNCTAHTSGTATYELSASRDLNVKPE
jgi:hypothetical protein